MVGLERSTLPLVGRDDFGLSSTSRCSRSSSPSDSARRSPTSPRGRWWSASVGGGSHPGVAACVARAAADRACSELGLHRCRECCAWPQPGAHLVHGRRDEGRSRRSSPAGRALGLNEAAGYLGVAVARRQAGCLLRSSQRAMSLWSRDSSSPLRRLRFRLLRARHVESRRARARARPTRRRPSPSSG